MEKEEERGSSGPAEKGGSRDDFCAWLFVYRDGGELFVAVFFRDGVFLVIIRIKTLWHARYHATVAFTTTLPGHVL